MNHELNIIGIMSGSSLDGIDIANCRIWQSDGKLFHETIRCKTASFSDDLSHKLGSVRDLSARDLLETEVEFSTFCADQILEFLSDALLRPDYIASHGHTIRHHPELGFTQQIGSGAIIATKTKISTIVDFRSNDVALGGQGAPIAPIVEKLLYSEHQLYLNLGGIANVSIHNQEISSWDICPFNQVLNHLANQLQLPYDDRGNIARRGTPYEPLIQEWQALPYFRQDPPKSMDNGWIIDTFLPKLQNQDSSTEDQLATMVAFAARQIAKDISQHAPTANGSMLVTGGGAYNSFFVEQLRTQESLAKINIVIPEKTIIEYKEAILMALMGYLRVQHVANTLPSVTGASRSSIGGAIYLP